MADAERVRLAARVRAAIAYSGMQADEVAERIGGEISVAMLRRITSSTRPRGASLDELWKIAEVCGVPRSWFESGQWDDQAEVAIAEPKLLGKGSPAERLAIVERYLEAIIAQNGPPVVSGTTRKKSGPKARAGTTTTP